MTYRSLDVEKWDIKSKRKRNQFINEFLNDNYHDLLISKKDFKKRHKQNVINMFEVYGWNYSIQSFVEDCLISNYWYEDPICYKTELDNLDFMDFNEKFIELFGKDILKNKLFLRKIKAINNVYLNSCYK